MGRNNHPPLEATEAFVQVAQSLGFTQASRVTGLSVSTLSRLVKELEGLVGAQLLTRTTRRVLLTEAGQLYLAHARRLLDAQRAAVDAVTELMGGVPRGTLRVSMPVAVGERLLGPRLPELKARYPELRLEVDLSDRNVPLVEGGFDLAIRVGRLADSSLRSQMLGRITRHLVASPRYLERRGAPKRPDQLIEHDLVVTGPLSTVEWAFYKKGEKVRLQVEGAVQTTSPSLAAQLAAQGLGILRTTEWVIRDELTRGDLVEVMSDWRCDAPTERPEEMGVPVWVVYSQGADTSPPLKSRVFVEMVQQAMRQEVQGRRRRRA